MTYWAHSDPNELPETHPAARWQPLNEHLRQVGAIAEAIARDTKPSDLGFHATAKATEVFIDALGAGAILEHHSGDTDSTDDEDAYESPHKRRATENWEAPIIVTTPVGFFESLFSHRPADLRRVHNIARSIVILDEVQTLPRWAPDTVQEIMPHPRESFGQLKRVEVEWPHGKSTWNTIAAGLVGAGRALCIVNTRRHASALSREVSGNPDIDDASVFHLSTRIGFKT